MKILKTITEKERCEILFKEGNLITESELLSYQLKSKDIEKLIFLVNDEKKYYYKCQFKNGKLVRNFNFLINFFKENNIDKKVWLVDFLNKMDDETTQSDIKNKLYYQIINPYGDFS